MANYKVLMIHPDGTEEMENEVFSTVAEAEAHGCYMRSCIRQGAETLYLSNPEEYPMDDFEDSGFKIIEIDE